MMTKNILIPTDFSANARNAVNYALQLYKEENCQFIFLNAYYASGFDKGNLLVPEPSKEEKTNLERASLETMGNLKKYIASLDGNPQHSFKFLNVFGSFYNVVKDTVKEEAIDLVIMGTKGRSNKNSVILGSNAVNIMEKVRACPVFAIPAHVRFKNPNEIVFPTSFRSHYKEKELKVLVNIANITQSPIRILHVQNDESLSKEQEENLMLLESILGTATFTHHRLYDMKVQKGVKSFIQSRESEMIAFVNKKHNFFGSIFSNPMVKELGTHTEVPLLAMHDSRN